MRPIVLTATAAGPTAWAPINELQNSFGIGLGGSVTSGANLTWKVQHTFDDSGLSRSVAVTRVGTTATVVDADHRLSTGDSVVVTGSASIYLDGTWTIASIIDANSYTYTVTNAGITTGSDNTNLTSFRVYDHATLTGQTGRADGNYAFPVQCVRLNVTAYVSGKADLTILQAIGR